MVFCFEALACVQEFLSVLCALSGVLPTTPGPSHGASSLPQPNPPWCHMVPWLGWMWWVCLSLSCVGWRGLSRPCRWLKVLLVTTTTTTLAIFTDSYKQTWPNISHGGLAWGLLLPGFTVDLVKVWRSCDLFLSFFTKHHRLEQISTKIPSLIEQIMLYWIVGTKWTPLLRCVV